MGVVAAGEKKYT